MKAGLKNENLMPVILTKFKDLWPYYILQSLLASLAIFILILALTDKKIVVISTMGATSFIVFAMPQTVSVKTKNVIGGHPIGLGCGAIFFLMQLPAYISYLITIAIAIYLMAALGLEHPPAPGTAPAVAMNKVSIDVFLTIMPGAVILSQTRYYPMHHLKDLV